MGSIRGGGLRTESVERSTVRFLDGLQRRDRGRVSSAFPVDGASVVVGRIADHTDALWPPERECLKRMRPQRTAEYSSGRRVAREALDALGVDNQPVVTRGKAPAWPAGVVGSIAHTRELAVAVAAREETISGLGVDLELVSRVGERVAKRVLSDREIAQCHDSTWQTLLFSAKEAVYKAVNPLVGEYLGFRDVEIHAAVTGTFEVRTMETCQSTDYLRVAKGYFVRLAGHWMTLVVIPG